MAKQITDNASKSPVAQEDILLVRDVTSNTDKKTTVSGLSAAVAANVPEGGLSSKSLTNPHQFRVYRNSAFSLTAGSFTKIPYDTKSYDTGSNLDIVTNTGRFTAVTAGFYHFDATVYIAAGGDTSLWCVLYKNGTRYAAGNKFSANVTSAHGSDAGSVASSGMQLAVGDYVEVFVFCNGSASLVVSSPANNYFSGHLVSKG